MNYSQGFPEQLAFDDALGAAAVGVHERRAAGDSHLWGTGGAATLAMTLAGLANTSARAGAGVDLGAVFPRWAEFWLTTTFALAPTAGNVVELWWATSPDNQAWPGAATGSDAAFTAANTGQLILVGTLVALANTASQTQLVGSIQLPSRYGAPVIANKSGQTLSATASDHLLRMQLIL